MKKIREIPAKPKEIKEIRVAAYARVSKAQDAAFHSLEAQPEYYQKYISEHPGWKLVAIYSDNGISGTLINRPEFQRMVQDCRDGKIDLVVTKSVTRFARNTVVLLETVRELKSLGIDCYFEKENMHSISPDGELLLTLLAMYAEEEARSVSENIRWKAKKKFESGIAWSGGMLGYRLIGDTLEIVPEEAEAVRQIFADYLSGMGLKQIAQKCKKNYAHITRVTWSVAGVRYILQNEKYAGDLKLMKSYLVDFRTKKRKPNNGDVRQYYVEDAHEAIIDRETFDAVQAIFKERKSLEWLEKAKQKNPFVGMIFCENCGRRFARRAYKYKDTVYAYWVCGGHLEYGNDYCPVPRISETTLVEQTQLVLGTDEPLSPDILECIEKITVSNDLCLTYVFKDGRNEKVYFESTTARKRRKE